MKFILIVLIVHGAGPAVTSAEFESIEACLHAADRFKALAPPAGVRFAWDCVPKGQAIPPSEK